MQDSIRALLIEDHTEYRDVVEIALGTASDIELVGTFGAAEIALRRLVSADSVLHPDVILLDLNLPGMDGLEAISPLLANTSDAKIIVLTQSDREADVMRAISLGAVGYLLKSSTVTQIVDGIRSAMLGDAPIDASVAKYILKTLQRIYPKDEEKNGLLTKREMEILRLIADGYTKKEIAKELHVSNSTVSTHTVHIFEKLRVQNAPAAVAKAFRLGLISPQ